MLFPKQGPSGTGWGSDQYRNITFSHEDIFHNYTLKNLTDLSHFEIKEVFTMILGRCYAIQKKSEVTIFDFTTTFIFKTTFDLQVFIHNTGKGIIIVSF